jgi:HEAT repeat protein
MVYGRIADPKDIQDMANMLDDTDDGVQMIAITAMARTKCRPSAELLAERLRDRTYNRVFCVYSTREAAMLGEVPVKMTARSFIAFRLGECGRDDAMHALKEAIGDGDSQLSGMAEWAVNEIEKSREKRQ